MKGGARSIGPKGTRSANASSENPSSAGKGAQGTVSGHLGHANATRTPGFYTHIVGKSVRSCRENELGLDED